MAKRLEIRRHSLKGKALNGDSLSLEGIELAMKTGARLKGNYTHLYSSGAQRATQTICCFIAAKGQKVVYGPEVNEELFSPVFEQWSKAVKQAGYGIEALQKTDPKLIESESKRIAEVYKQILDGLPQDGYAFAVGHGPLVETGIYGLTGKIYPPTKECEGFIITLEDDGTITIEECRL